MEGHVLSTARTAQIVTCAVDYHVFLASQSVLRLPWKSRLGQGEEEEEEVRLAASPLPSQFARTPQPNHSRKHTGLGIAHLRQNERFKLRYEQVNIPRSALRPQHTKTTSSDVHMINLHAALARTDGCTNYISKIWTEYHSCTHRVGVIAGAMWTTERRNGRPFNIPTRIPS